MAGAVGGAILSSFGKKSLAQRTIDQALEALETENKTLRESLGELRQDVQRMASEHRTEIGDMKREHAGCEKRLAELRAEIDRLMDEQRNQPASYGPADLKRVGRSRARP